MNWKELQDKLLEGRTDWLWAFCPACGEKVLQAVGMLHLKQVHSEIAENIEKVIKNGNRKRNY